LVRNLVGDDVGRPVDLGRVVGVGVEPDRFRIGHGPGKGLGKAMLKEIARQGVSRGFERIDFMVLDWNTPAIEFYKSLGADSNDEESHFQFRGEAFRKLAS